MKKLLNKISKKTQKRILIISGSIIVVLVITNPSSNSFEKYLNSKGFETENKVLPYNKFAYHSSFYSNPITTEYSYGRENNYFVFSTFRYNDGEYHGNDSANESYFGILGNFFKL